eukprot:scaffold710_cov171-Amphora_coffeaeformis.AAC.15
MSVERECRIHFCVLVDLSRPPNSIHHIPYTVPVLVPYNTHSLYCHPNTSFDVSTSNRFGRTKLVTENLMPTSSTLDDKNNGKESLSTAAEANSPC